MRLLSSDYNPLKVNREDLRFLVFVLLVSLRQRIIQGFRVIPFHMILGMKVIARSQHASNRKQKKLAITLAPPSQPIRCKPKINHNFVPRIFLHFRPFACIYFESWLVPCDISLFLTGHCGYFGFGFTVLNWKALWVILQLNWFTETLSP